MTRDAKVYRGVVIESIFLRDQYGNMIPANKTHYLKPYDKPGPAKGSVTAERKRLGNRLKDAYVEVSTQWERL